MENDSDTIDFGFQRVKRTEKAGLVRNVFDSVADNYDLMNDLMSGGVHRIWKSVMLDRLSPRPGQVLLDVAGGTGDIALGFLQRAEMRAARSVTDQYASGEPVDGPSDTARPASAIVCDINHEMLNAGASRKENTDFRHQMSFLCGDAEALPLPDRSVDAYTISLGIRNVTDRDRALREAFRVLRPGGRFACLEFSQPILPTFQTVYDAYSFNVIPWLGERVANNREAYEYLVESIREFPTQEAFADQIRDSGLSRVRYENLTGGVAALHLAWRL